jgi:NTP pyrophosphatase (non-canonical NTP hydrolase)
MNDELMLKFSKMVNEICQSRILNLDSKMLHSVLGIGTEAGEILDIIKKNMFYGKEIDNLHLKEEIGDLLFYIQDLCINIGTSFEEVLKINIAKLRTRYPNGYTQQNALIRDLKLERLNMNKVDNIDCNSCKFHGNNPHDVPCNTCHSIFTGNSDYPKWEFKCV